MSFITLVFGLNETKKFKINKTKFAKLEVINSSLYVIFDMAMKQKITDLDRDIVILTSGKEFELFVLKDYNFDGFTDIGILVDIGVRDINLFRDYYLFSAKKKRYVKSISNISNLRISRKNRELIGSQKSIESYISTIYKISNQIPYISMKKESFMQSGIERIRIFNKKGILQKSIITPKFTKIKSKKSYFYLTPNGNATKRYIIRNDKIKLLDIDIKNKMIFIKFKGKKIFKRWIKIETIQ